MSLKSYILGLQGRPSELAGAFRKNAGYDYESMGNGAMHAGLTMGAFENLKEWFAGMSARDADFGPARTMENLSFGLKNAARAGADALGILRDLLAVLKPGERKAVLGSTLLAAAGLGHDGVVGAVLAAGGADKKEYFGNVLDEAVARTADDRTGILRALHRAGADFSVAAGRDGGRRLLLEACDGRFAMEARAEALEKENARLKADNDPVARDLARSARYNMT